MNRHKGTEHFHHPRTYPHARFHFPYQENHSPNIYNYVHYLRQLFTSLFAFGAYLALLGGYTQIHAQGLLSVVFGGSCGNGNGAQSPPQSKFVLQPFEPSLNALVSTLFPNLV